MTRSITLSLKNLAIVVGSGVTRGLSQGAHWPLWGVH